MGSSFWPIRVLDCRGIYPVFQGNTVWNRNIWGDGAKLQYGRGWSLWRWGQRYGGALATCSPKSMIGRMLPPPHSPAPGGFSPSGHLDWNNCRTLECQTRPVFTIFHLSRSNLTLSSIKSQMILLVSFRSFPRSWIWFLVLPPRLKNKATQPAVQLHQTLLIHWTVQVCCSVQVGVNAGSLANWAG